MNLLAVTSANEIPPCVQGCLQVVTYCKVCSCRIACSKLETKLPLALVIASLRTSYADLNHGNVLQETQAAQEQHQTAVTSDSS